MKKSEQSRSDRLRVRAAVVSPRQGMPLAISAFSALRHPNFRLFYLGQILSLSGTWMQTTAQGWLVLELTDSEFLLGLAAAAGQLPVLIFTLYAGVLADRADKRRILIMAQSAALLQAMAMAVMTDLGTITFGWIIVLVLVLGTANAFEIPTRQAFYVDLVDRKDLTNAIALNSSAFSATRIVGPAVAGALIGAVGIASAFYINAASYLGVLAALLLIKLPRYKRVPRTTTTRENLREGFGFIRDDRAIRTLIGLIAGISIFGYPYVMLMPVFARDVLGAGAVGLGWLLAASGAGSLTGALALAALPKRVRRGPLLLASSLGFTVFLGGFALSRSFPLSLALLAGAGFTMILNNVTTNVLVQSLVPDRLRGRVMSVYVFMFMGMAPVGALQAGTFARWLGAPTALLIGAITLFIIINLAWWRVRELREID
ncbi:MAG TPA: MFS transporter [Longimicrobiaceae bacterium]|nr:MFS transporter [Longimicrobiaceae bacterium]